MNKHVKVTPETTDLSRRSFLVGTAATGLVLKRGHDLRQVLKVFEKRKLRVVGA